MKAKIYLTSVILFLLFTGNLFAQTVEAKMVFDTEKHDFGKINEEDGNVEYKFVFTNLGGTSISITNVNSSCGCTTPTWSQEPVPPGGKGFVSAVYNPKNRPGAFHKTITITSNADNSPVTLHINGDVISKPVDPIETKYKYVKGPIRMDKANIHIPEIYNDETKTEVIQIYNNSTEDVTVTFNEKRFNPKHLTFKCEPETLKPKEEGKISVTYNAALKNDFGYVYDRVYMNFNHDQDPNNRITISTVIKEHFTQEMIDNPPVFTMMNDKIYDFGKINEGDKVEYVFKFKNTGKNDLIIRKTKASCGCTAIAPQDKVVKPGQESSIKAVFNSKGKRGNQNKSITVTTNIPDNGDNSKSEIILMLKGYVEPANTGDNGHEK